MFTIAEIVSDCISEFGEFCSLKDASRAVRASLGFYLNAVSQSNQNQRIDSFEFSVGENRTKTLTALPAGANPAWVEARVSHDDDWAFVPAVNLDNLEDYRLSGSLACAFYRTDGRHTIKFSIVPSCTLRLWFDPDPIAVRGFEDESGLPAVFNQMVADRATLDLIGVVMNKAAQLETAENPVSQSQILAWRTLETRLREKLLEWEPQWKDFCFGSRSSQRGRMRRKVLSRLRYY